MEKQLQNYKGTVAYALNKHKDELNKALSNSSMSPSTFNNLKVLVNNILTKDEEIRPSQAQQAIRMLGQASSHPNYYLSTLAAYMSGIAVGK